jgi:O-antigen/teichoic acid export membrane protein
VLLVIPQSASLVIYGRQGELGPDGVWPLQRKMLLGVVALTAIAGLAMAMSAHIWLPWVAGPGYEPAIPLLLAMLPILVMLSFSSMMASQWIGRGFFLTASLLTVLVGLVNLLASSVWIPEFGMMGAVYAQLLALLVAVFTNSSMALWCELKSRRLRAESGK